MHRHLQLPKMIVDSLLPRPRTLSGLLAITLFASGCSPLVFREPATPPSHAFISYEAPKPGNKSLRLAIKDLIDIKGEVTSAGSEYLYKHAKTGKGRRGMFADRMQARGSNRRENESQRVGHRSFRFQRLFRNADQPSCQGPCAEGIFERLRCSGGA
jgi:hypothetical protein